MNRDRKIAILVFIILTGFVAAVFYHYVYGVSLNLGYPYDTFLFLPSDRWMDFVWPYRIAGNPYIVARPDFQNFPFLYKTASVFVFLGPKLGLAVFLLVYSLLFFSISFMELKNDNPNENKLLTLQNSFVFTFLSYPFLIAFDRANFEIVVFFCLFFYVFFYQKHSFVSAIFLGFAIALKAFPVILAIPLLSNRRYKEIALAAVISLSVTLISYATLPGGIIVNIPLHIRNLQLYNQAYAVAGNSGLYFGISAFGALKFVAILTNLSLMSGTTYSIFSIAALVVISVYVILIEKKFWKKIALLVCALNLLPMVSGDYKLLHIFIPVFLLIGETEREPLDWLYIVLFGLLLIPKNYYLLSVLPIASISILLNPLLMFAIVILIIVTGLTQFTHERRINFRLSP